jgi:hypothetical protein
VPPRGPVGDAFVSRRHPRFAALPPGAVVATSSLRRRSQLLHRRPDLRVGAAPPWPGDTHQRNPRSAVDAAGRWSGRPGAGVPGW